jgi:sugar lactone lactonase YvrE
MLAELFRRWTRASLRRGERSGHSLRRSRSPLCLEQLEDRLVPSTLIPVTNHRDLVFDPMRGQLDITTSAGTVQRYDVASQTLLAPLTVGTSLNGADITPDGSALYVTEGLAGSTQGVVHQVDLTTGQVTDLPYNLAFYEGGSWDVAVGANGKGLLTTKFNGSGWVPLRQIDLSSDTLSVRTDDPGSGYGGQVRQNTRITRSADRSLFLLTESNISSGPMFTYNPATDTFSSTSLNTNAFLDNAPIAVSRNGSLIAVEEYNQGLTVFSANLTPLRNLPGLDGGVVFDPVRDMMYAVDTATDQIVAYDTNSWTVQYQLPIGESVGLPQAFGNGVMAMSNDGGHLFLATASGVRDFNLQTTVSFAVAGFPASVTAGSAGSLTVTALNLAGQVATGYTGTVHFTSSDGQALLPADYTLTAADQGVHTFTATLTTAGSQWLQVSDTRAPGVNGSQSGITVTPAAAASLVVSTDSATTAGSAIPFTVQALDAYGNVATGYTGTVHFTSSDTQAGLPADYTFTAGDAGVHQFSVTLKTAGSQSVTATDKAYATLQVQASVAVSPGAFSVLKVGGFPAGTAGTAGNFTVSAYDAYHNLLTGYLGTISFSSSDAQATLPSPYTFTAGDAGSHVFAATLKTAGSQSLTATDSAAGIGGSQTGITIVAGALRALILTGFPTPTTAGVSHTFQVRATDAYGNTVSSYRGSVRFSSSDARASLPGSYTFNSNDAGTHTFTATLKTAGSQSLTATDTTNQLSGSEAGIQVVAAAAARVIVSAPSTAKVGTPVTVVVTIVDAYGNVATGYTGTVHFRSSDSKAQLPANYTFTAADAGTHSFTVLFGSTGTDSLVVTDTVKSSITGSTSVKVST